MNPLDVIISDGVRDVLERDLGKTTYRKIEKEVQTMYGITVQQAAGDFAKLDLVLRKFFGRHASNIESRVFKKILTPVKGTKGNAILKIKDPIVAKTIFESYGDPAKKIILDMMTHKSRTIPDVITASKLPKASTYSRIKSLINSGLLSMVGHTKAKDGRSVSVFSATLYKTVFDVKDSKILVSASMNDGILSKSFAYNSIVQI